MGVKMSVVQVLVCLLLICVHSTRISEVQQAQQQGRHAAAKVARNKELLYSRQTFAHGKDAQERLASGSVTVVGHAASFRY